MTILRHWPPGMGFRISTDWPGHMHQRLGEEIMKRTEACNHRCKGGRHVRRTHVSNVLLAMHVQVVNLGMKRPTYLSGGSAENDRGLARGNRIDSEAVSLEPRGHDRNVSIRDPVAGPELFCTEPLVKLW